MRARHSGGTYLGPHAILAVGTGNSPDLYHWSYSSKTFIRESHGSPPVDCRPRRHFAATFANAPPADRPSIRFAGMRFSIPDRYRGHISGASLVFSAMAPDFENVLPEARSLEAILSQVEVNFADSHRTDAWLSKTSSNCRCLVEDTGEEFGLRAQTRWSVDTSGRKKPSPSFQYFTLSSDNRVATVISCLDKVKIQCMHAFRNGGWTYTFHHSPADLKHWKRMQDKLVELTHSFVQAPASSLQ
jgi:hypothetical protein